ncbi:MAG: hypothetical protein K8Q89_01710 [Nitrosarchaeum sp.]|nr:hypothetical protein [Nitrosarchaeum sp.]
MIFEIAILPNNVYAQTTSASCTDSLVTSINSSYNGPVIVDSYFTDSSSSTGTIEKPSKLEIGPGDGPTTLAVVITNRSQLEVYAVTGFLKLPNGFSPGGISANRDQLDRRGGIFADFANPAIASYGGTVGPAETITLYFDLNVLDTATVGKHNAQLIVKFYTIYSQAGCNSALIDVPFVLPGKVILDIVSTNQKLSPKSENAVNFSIVNKGSSPATGVVATIVGLGDANSKSSGNSGSLVLQSSSTELVNLGSSSFNVGTIPAYGNTTLSTVIFPSSDAGGTVQNVDIQLSYGNAYGYRQSQTLSTGLVISPTPTDTSLIVTTADNTTPLLITAGTSQDVVLDVLNSGKTPLTDVIVTLSTDTTSLKIVGKPKWIIPEIAPGESQQITSQVFAATSIINTPVSFLVTEDYIVEGEKKTETINIGGYVAGTIMLKLYDTQVSQQANQFSVVGNILNQGSTTGKFSSIELVLFSPNVSARTNPVQPNGFTSPGSPQTSESKPFANINSASGVNPDHTNPQGSQQTSTSKKLTSAPQYLGDLPDDSTIPFSITLPPSQIIPGTYPATFKIVYTDDLKKSHEVLIDSHVTFEPPQNNLNSVRNQRSNTDIPIYVYPIIAAAAVGIAVVIIKIKKSKSKSKNNYNKDDIVSILDDTSISKSD